MGRYSNIGTRKTDDGVEYYKNVIYPEIELDEEDIYVVTTLGDRYDKLASQFYSNVEYWWIIASANGGMNADSLAITPGTQIRIPAYPEQYIIKYQELNK
jgi:hypothetical protein